MSAKAAAQRWITGLAAVALLALAPAAQASIPLELRFDGRAFEPTVPPDFSCRNKSLKRWVSCRVEKLEAPGAYMLERLPPGRYMLHASIDDNSANPRRYPGDYEAQLAFEVTESAPERLTVDLPRILHLTHPADNGSSLQGMLNCATQPKVETPRYSWGPVAQVTFAWEPIIDDAEYRYSLAAAPCNHAGDEEEVLSGRTEASATTIALPPSLDGQYYTFRINAWKDNVLVGELWTHDSGGFGWEYRFGVNNASLPRWIYLAAGAGLLLLLAYARRFLGSGGSAQRRYRARLLAPWAVVALAIGAITTSGYFYFEERERRRAAEEMAIEEAERQAEQRDFIVTFVSAAPRPDWWDTVETPNHVDNLGDLRSAWADRPRDDEGLGERQFFKTAYQGILDHPEDEHVVATAIDLLHYVVSDYPHHLELARLGYDFYFRHRQRTDNCANCMVGDRTQGLAKNLGQLYAAAGRYDEAIEVLQQLITERSADVSPYKLAETWDQLAWIEWRKGEREMALEVIGNALARYGDTSRGERLRSTLARFELERDRAAGH